MGHDSKKFHKWNSQTKGQTKPFLLYEEKDIKAWFHSDKFFIIYLNIASLNDLK